MVDRRVASAPVTVIVAHDEHDPAERYLPNCRRDQLICGDYWWTGKGRTQAGSPAQSILCMLERKKVNEDLARCVVQTNRHLDQLRRMKQESQIQYFVVEGPMRMGVDGLVETMYWENRRPVWKAIQPPLGFDRLLKHLETLEHSLGVFVRRTADYRETCQLIAALSSWWQTAPDRHQSADELPQPFALFRWGTVARIAAQLDGIGPDKAGKVGREFKTPADLHHGIVGLEALMKIEGVGPMTAASVYKEWTGSSPPAMPKKAKKK
ncbi:MAG: helix-hairpin-helix domain-containing protein [Dehalococcoidia bacterium]|nr:helix-hairpin-helix domain-containing protein [Dehalococcoidia bacterium]